MDKLLRPERFDCEPNTHKASHEFKHWMKTFENFLSSVENLNDEGKLKILINYVSHNVYDLISDSKSYEEAVNQLQKIYVKPKNEVYSRHVLATCKQQSGESIDQFLQKLKHLSKDCNFQEVTAEENKNDFIRDSFITGLISPHIRQRLLENNTLKLEDAVNQARALESAQKHSETYQNQNNFVNSITDNIIKQEEPRQGNPLTASGVMKCYFCGKIKHPRSVCPARDSECRNCGVKGHFSIVCHRKKGKVTNLSAMNSESAAFLAAAPECLSKSVVKVKVNNITADALIDTGSSETFINKSFVDKVAFIVVPGGGQISMASVDLQSRIYGHCFVNIELLGHNHLKHKVSVLPNLCADMIIGHDILSKHSNICINFGGTKPPLALGPCSLPVATVDPPELFANLSPDCHPIKTKSRKFSVDETKFIEGEISKLLSEGIIEESNSPWRAQVLVTKSENHKRRLVIDYSQTINRFTYLDGYPLPNIDNLVTQVSKYKIFSTIDLRSAYHQIPIRGNEKKYTGFEAGGKLYHFNRIPFGVTNGVACFQRVIDRVISKENLKGVFAYLDDLTVCGQNQEEHDTNLSKFLETAKKYGLTLNEEKCSYSKNSIKLLGYLIENNIIKPDPERLDPLLKLPVPNNTDLLRRAIGMLAHYSRWIPRFSEKISRLVKCKTFPLTPEVVADYENLKLEIAQAAVKSIEDSVPFVVETDASENALSATLSQMGRPVAFFSRSLSDSEKRHSIVEKEAAAIVEAVKKWRHFLIGRHFKIITDQRSVAFIFDQKHSSKIKNEKLQRWRLELSCFSFDTVYRPGSQNTVADAFTRLCSSLTNQNLFELHKSLCHPGVTRMAHWVRTHNLPYSVEDIRKMTAGCTVCAEIKPNFLKNSGGHLIKAMAPFERLNMDFKGPIPSSTSNIYMLTIVDEYSRYPFAFPCSDMTSKTIIRHLFKLFTVFGTPAYIHTDQGSSFMSEELRSFLHNLGIATSRSSPYNPRGNGQVERFNGVIWNTIRLALRSRQMRISEWESILDEALHSIRSLLSTATNCTPHERMFRHERRSSNGYSIPSWLVANGKVLMKKQVRHSKYDPLVEEVQVIEVNPNYSLIRNNEGKESIISNRYLAPKGDTRVQEDQTEDQDMNDTNQANYPQQTDTAPTPPVTNNPPSPSPSPVLRHLSPPEENDAVSDQALQSVGDSVQGEQSQPRRSLREKKLPMKLNDYKIY